MNKMTPDTFNTRQPERLMVLLIFSLIFFIGTDVIQTVLGPGGIGGPLRFLLLLPAFGIVFLNYRYLIKAVVAAPELALLLMLAVVSVSWTETPVNTIRKLLPLMATTLLAMTLAATMSLKALFRNFALLGVVAALASLVAIALFADARGAEPWPNTWRGVFNHKNGFGAISAISLLVIAPVIATSSGRQRRMFAIGGVFLFAMLIMSESRTSQIIAVISLSAFYLATLLRGYTRLWAAAYIGLFVLLIFAIYVLFASGTWDDLLGSLGRKPTLSGRIPIWSVVWPSVIENIWLGYGFDGFWDAGSRRVIEIARDKSVGFLPYYSHNGLIELLLDVGIFGVPLFLLHLVRSIRGCLTTAVHHSARLFGAGALVLILAFIMFNITESSILSGSSMNWMTFVALTTKASILLRTSKLKPKSSPGIHQSRLPHGVSYQNRHRAP